MSAMAVKAHGINGDQESVDRSEESLILEDLSSSPLESDHARLSKNNVVEATNSRRVVAAGSLRTRSANVPVRPTSTKKVLALPEWDEDSHPEESGDFWQLVSKHKPTRKKKVLYIGALVKDCTSQKLQDFVERRASATGLTVSQIYGIHMLEKNDHSCARMIVGSKVPCPRAQCNGPARA